jgi:hypothetical protein
MRVDFLAQRWHGILCDPQCSWQERLQQVSMARLALAEGPGNGGTPLSLDRFMEHPMNKWMMTRGGSFLGNPQVWDIRAKCNIEDWYCNAPDNEDDSVGTGEDGDDDPYLHHNAHNIPDPVLDVFLFVYGAYVVAWVNHLLLWLLKAIASIDWFEEKMQTVCFVQ